ncbi:hypothetical protein QIT80_gp48 (endogenous virus) [Pseudomonas phage phiAH14a]|uniref:Uncharacterized protein n=1 Tax=Pseudomonas phage phiAH14a TaxID=1805958 RepID=A0A1B0VNB4_9CAUD|nr:MULTISPECIES: hypothetical protein [unclassified Pseudomonas]YP_010773065.1 hypothetical protein QIT80_gp48 [Pseudomonas phage phiAH14a]AMW64508.1 hypothetical protein AH14a_p48 [Pseudomonas phage phiAH14a]KAA0946668.1 hypothetical protein FQ182_13150 [Pseudomonas sp. ANT_H4]KAA0953231.1 hypothetical protein FQ186_06715 [Pseudomonas sp. ANT_H14]
MTDMICRKSMSRCQTPGMCSPHGGCQPEDSHMRAIRSLRGDCADLIAERDRLKAENERLKTLRSKTERELAQELEVWRHGPSCWNCGDTGDVHDMLGEWRGQCDCNAAKLIDVASERDALKAEIAGLKTGYAAYERVNEELKVEVSKWKSESVGDSQEIYSLSCALAQRTGEVRELAAIVDDLCALTKQFAQSLRKAAPGNDLPEKALDYLRRKGLQGSPMRNRVAAADTPVDAAIGKGEQS